MIEKFPVSNLLIPFGYYNYFIGFLGGVLLILSGKWLIVVGGIALIITAYWVLKILFYIPIIFAFPAMILYRKKSKLFSFIFILAAILSRTSIIVFWCYIVFLNLFKVDTGASVALLFLGYGIINIPLNKLALRDVKNRSRETVHETLVLETMMSAGLLLNLIMNIDINSLIIITGVTITLVRLIQYFTDIQDAAQEKTGRVFTTDLNPLE